MATMKDIARLAKVSTSTVSHVINGSRYVSDDIRQKVLKVVEELNYRPSHVARSLKVKQTNTLGMLITTNHDPFFAEMLNAVEHYCHQHHYHLILSNTDGDPARLQENLQMLLQKQVDGLILMCTEANLTTPLPPLPLPHVVLDWWPEALNADTVFENAYLGGQLATQHLIQQGHKKIAMITGNLNKYLAQQRLQGFLDQMTKDNLPINPLWIIESDFSCLGGVNGMKQLLNQKTHPTAVICSSDTIAIGAYQVAQSMGLSIGKDISIIGYDDIQLAQFLYPPLTTIHQPKYLLAKKAIEVLLQRIREPSQTFGTFMVEPWLMERGSVFRLE